jgi:hypothetical protein
LKPLTRLALLALLTPACILAQTTASLPPNYKTILETPAFRVIRVHYGAHEKVPVHDHPDTPTVYVYLNDSGPIRIIHEEKDGTQSTVVRPPTHTGAFRVSSGMLERHSIENPGDLPSDFLRVELLNLRLGDKALEFRGPAPTDTTHKLSTTEFTSPRLSILRVICVDKAPCAIPASPEPSVIVALSNSTITTKNKNTKLEPGSVTPIAAQQPFAVSPSGTEPAHILQIAINPAPSKQ